MLRYTQAPQCLLPTIYKWQHWFQVWTTLCAAGGRGKTPKWTNILQTDAELTSWKPENKLCGADFLLRLVDIAETEISFVKF